jgi:hypothetical protein
VVRWWWQGGWAEVCNKLLLWRRHNRKLVYFCCENKFTRAFIGYLHCNFKKAGFGFSEDKQLVKNIFSWEVFTLIQ